MQQFINIQISSQQQKHQQFLNAQNQLYSNQLKQGTQQQFNAPGASPPSLMQDSMRNKLTNFKINQQVPGQRDDQDNLNGEQQPGLQNQ